jgi:hypothetical protein
MATSCTQQRRQHTLKTQQFQVLQQSRFRKQGQIRLTGITGNDFTRRSARPVPTRKVPVREPIQEIAAEFNRYSRNRLVVADDSLSHLRVGGRFSAFEPDSFTATTGRAFVLRIEKYPTSSGAVIRLERMSSGLGMNASSSHRKGEARMLSRSQIYHE